VQDLDVEPLLGKEALGFGQHGRQIHHEANPTDSDGDLLRRPGRGRAARNDHGKQDQHRHEETQKRGHDVLLSSRALHFGIGFQEENRASRRLRAMSMAMTAAIRTSSPASTPVALNIDSAYEMT